MSVFERCLEKCRARKGAVVYSDGEDRRVVSAAANGEFYGERKELSLDEIKTIVTAMKEREDCVDPNAVAEAGEGGGHGEAKKEAAGHEAPAEGEHASAEAAEGSHEVAANGH